MLRLRSSIFAHLVSSPAASPVSPLHRLLSAAAAAHAASTNPSFDVEQYLVDNCGLTRAQALKASTKLSHLKSPTNPDAVLAFLAGLGLSSTDVAALVAKDPKFLCTGVDRTLGPIVDGLTGLGLSRSEIARIASLAPLSFRRRSIVSNLPYCRSLFGTFENLAQFLKKSSGHLRCSLEKATKPNVEFLQECGLGACDIAKLGLSVRWILDTKPERVRAMAARAEAIGVPRGSGMFRLALQAVAFLSEEKIAVRVGYLKNTFRWSDAEVGIVVCKFPMVLAMSKEMLQTKSEFLISEVGLEPAYVVQRPVLLGYSLQGRLRPRHYALKFLKENGLLDHGRDYYSAIMVTEKVFVENYIAPHKEAAPHLAKDYADASRGQVPTRFRFG
ncbi:unnamed protein product [Alopecurus aequalis]